MNKTYTCNNKICYNESGIQFTSIIRLKRPQRAHARLKEVFLIVKASSTTVYENKNMRKHSEGAMFLSDLPIT